MAKQIKGRKFFAATASAALVASAIVPVASAADLKDANKIPSWAKDEVQALVDAGVIQGDQNGNFNPAGNVTRAAAAEILYKALGLSTDGTEDFSDVNKNNWFYDAVVATSNAGIFEGNEKGEFKPNDPLTREQAALVIVRAFGLEGSADLSGFADANKVSGWAKAGVATAVANGVIKGDGTSLNPGKSISRAEIAVMVYRVLEEDTGVIGAASVKAINNTTVEVTFKEEVEDVKSLDFTIEGLEVNNAAVKQTDAKTVVLTTSAQEGGKKYTVAVDGQTVGSFEGISSIIPTKIDLNTDAVQGVVGQQVTLSADIGQKAAGVPVTFNIDAANNSLNKDIVAEVYTDANGVATYTYTQYNAGLSDDVAVYPTGAPQVRDFATVWWGVDTILKLEEDDKKGKDLNNGENKVYKITYKNPKTGKPVENEVINLTFVENVDKNVNEISDATVNGVTPYQLNNGRVQAVTVKTDSKGEATVTVSGTNAEATLVAFIDEANERGTATEKNRLERTELKVEAEKVTFGAIQTKYEIEVTRDGGEEAALGLGNGRVYKVVVKDEDGKVAAGEVVNVALEEDLDKVIATKTNAKFVEDSDLKGDRTYKNGDGQITLKLNSKGEGEFKIASTSNKDYATPVIWLDINSSNNKEGTLEEGEPNKVAGITYFAEEKVEGSRLKVYNNRTGEEIKDNRTQDGNDVVFFNFTVANQSGKTYGASIRDFKATFQVTNTGKEDVYVWTDAADVGNYAKATTISTRRGETFTLPTTNTNGVKIYVGSNGESATVDVKSYGQADYQDHNNEWKTARLSESKVATATFKSSADIGASHTGNVEKFDKDKKKIKFENKKELEYKEAFDAGDVKYEDSRGTSTLALNAQQFEDIVDASVKAGKTTRVHYYENKDGVITFTILAATEGQAPANPTITKVDFVDTDLDAGEIAGEIEVTATNASTIKAVLNGVELTGTNGKFTVAENTAYGEGKLVVTVTNAAGTSVSETVTLTDKTEASQTGSTFVLGETAQGKAVDNGFGAYVVSFLKSDLTGDAATKSNFTITVNGTEYTFTQSSVNTDRYNVSIPKTAATEAEILAATVTAK